MPSLVCKRLTNAPCCRTSFSDAIELWAKWVWCGAETGPKQRLLRFYFRRVLPAIGSPPLGNKPAQSEPD